MVTTNLLGPIRLTAALLPLLLRQRRSTITHVTSGLAFVPGSGVPTYSATKAAMGQPGTKIGELCTELGVSRQTLYRHVTPQGELRPDGLSLLARRKVPQRTYATQERD